MKRLAFLALLVVLAWAAPATAQVPQLLSYQGVLTDNAGNLVADGSYELTFRLYNVDVGGGALFTEAHTGANAVPVVKGGFTVVLGSLMSLTLPFDVQYWLEIEVAGGGGPMTPRVRLTSAPYALMAKTVANGAITSAKVLDNSLMAVDLAIGSVTTSEILDNTITGSDILAGAIGQTDIATGGVGSSEVADNSLDAVDMVDEPGVAFLEGETVDNLYSTPIMLAGRTINVPAAGYVVVMANATISIVHSPGTPDEAMISVSTTSGTHNTANQRAVRLSNLFTDGGTYRFGVHVQQVFSVASAGSYTYYLIGSGTTGGGLSSPEHSMLLLYMPTSYGGISSPEDAPARVKPLVGPDRP